MNYIEASALKKGNGFVYINYRQHEFYGLKLNDKNGRLYELSISNGLEADELRVALSQGRIDENNIPFTTQTLGMNGHIINEDHKGRLITLLYRDTKTKKLEPFSRAEVGKLMMGDGSGDEREIPQYIDLSVPTIIARRRPNPTSRFGQILI